MSVGGWCGPVQLEETDWFDTDSNSMQTRGWYGPFMCGYMCCMWYYGEFTKLSLIVVNLNVLATSKGRGKQRHDCTHNLVDFMIFERCLLWYSNFNFMLWNRSFDDDLVLWKLILFP